MAKELETVGHRPYPLPEGKWMMTQTWENLLFIHWRVPENALRPLLPSPLELDTFAGEAWIGIVPFQVTHQRFRMLPELPWLNSYLELNVRTYVKHNGIQGVYFFSLDTNHPLSVLGARLLSLPYHHARMEMKRRNRVCFFKSNRLFTHGKFTAEYEPVSAPTATVPGSHEYWLLERYSLFTVMGKHVLRGDIHHKEWNVSQTKLNITENTAAPLQLPCEEPLVHYSLTQKAFIWPLRMMEK